MALSDEVIYTIVIIALTYLLLYRKKNPFYKIIAGIIILVLGVIVASYTSYAAFGIIMIVAALISILHDLIT